MQRLPVDSSDIVAVGYDPKARLLEIEFKEGRVYHYADVAPDVYERFTRADSYGQYFYAFINGHYRYKRIEQKNDVRAPAALAFVTGNARKFHALQEQLEPLGIAVEQLDLPVDEIQSHDAQEIATKKAKQAHKLAGRPVVVNDAFWNIIALRGFPGAYMRHINSWLQAEDLLHLMEGKNDRTIICNDTLVYYDGKRSKVFTRDHNGIIASVPRGAGQPAEQLVVLTGQTKTIAELNNLGHNNLVAEESVWRDFAKWFYMQRRLGKA